MKIALLISGGVDSSVALRLLQEQGHEITAFYLKIWLEDELAFLGTCPWEEDLSYVKAVCTQTGIPLEVISLQREYHDEVVSYVIAEIKAGRTPNPDILCNQRIKFGAFSRQLTKFGQFDKIATGHYAQVREENEKFILYQAPDPIKDQTYFLSQLNQEQLSRILFPIGHLQKTAVRAYAQEFNLPNKTRKDSQGVCFLGKLKFSEFIKFHAGEKEGSLIEFETGKEIGTHKGFWFYTVGQRQGIGLSGGPWYVVAKEIEKNIVYISKSYYHEEKQRNTCLIGPMHWISGISPITIKPKAYLIKLRHGAHSASGLVTSYDNNTLALQLAESDQGIAPGQFAVLYEGINCLGSGTIIKTL